MRKLSFRPEYMLLLIFSAWVFLVFYTVEVYIERQPTYNTAPISYPTCFSCYDRTTFGIIDQVRGCPHAHLVP